MTDGKDHIAPAALLETVRNSIGTGNRRAFTTIDPAMAQELLNRYVLHSRPLNRHHVAELAHGLQHPDPEDDIMGDIAFAPSGQTVAGQHLLHAIIDSGVAADVWIILNAGPPWQFVWEQNLDTQIAQAIGDPGSIVTRDNDEESLTRWASRAVMAVLTRPGHCGCPGGYDLTPPPYRYIVNHTEECHDMDAASREHLIEWARDARMMPWEHEVVERVARSLGTSALQVRREAYREDERGRPLPDETPTTLT